LKVRRWRWIGHVLRREKDNNCRVGSPGPLEAREGPTDQRSLGGEPLKPNGKSGMDKLEWG